MLLKTLVAAEISIRRCAERQHKHPSSKTPLD
jgi:hypothetical protein